MKKIYTSTLLIVWFALLSGQKITAQIVANDDVRNFNGTSGQAPVFENSVIYNDMLNGIPYIYQLVTLTQISTTNPNVYLNNDWVNVTPGTPAGVYTIVYQICENANPGNCDTATVTVNVCNVDPPIIPVPTCASSSNSFLISGLPPTGTWTLTYTSGWNNPDVTITGTGSTYLLTGLTPNTYYFRVNNGSCLSSQVTVTLGYLSGGLSVNSVATYVDYNNDGLTNVGDILNVQFEVTNTLDCPLTNVTIGETSLNISGAPIASIAPGATDTSVTGVYVLQQSDINTGAAFGWSGVSAESNGFALYVKSDYQVPLNISDGITLNAFFDNNGNGIQDNGEASAYVGEYNVEMNNTGVHNISTYNSAYTFYETNPANTYNFSYTPYTYGCNGEYASNTVYTNVTVAAGSGMTVYNFPITTIPCKDVAVYLYGSWPRPGMVYYNYVTYGNAGNQLIPSGTITYTKDSLVSIAGVSEPGATLNANGFTYNFTNLQPGEYRYIYVDLDVPAMPTVNMGDQLTSTLAVAVPGGDFFTANNSDSLTQTVVNSYDPNDISEKHGPQIAVSAFTPADYLTYTIRFENTGNADAINIKITDALDSQLDAGSIKILASSHNYVLDRAGNNLEWKFNGINLPPSVDGTAIGKGFVVFQVKPVSYAVGDVIPNKADIYFDSNPGIETNTFDTEFVTTLAMNEFSADAVAVYPNPVQNVLRIQLKNSANGTVEIHDMLGKTVLSKTISNQNTPLDVSGLSNGMYFLRVNADGKEKTFKIIKQ